MFRFKSTLVLLVFSMSAAFAQVTTPASDTTGYEPSGYIGIKLGYADPTDLSARFGLGADVGYLMKDYGVTVLAYYLTSTGSQRSIDTRITHYGLGADYNLSRFFPDSLTGLKGGVRLGAGQVANSGAVSSTDNDMAGGLAITYDWMLNGYLSAGIEGSFLRNFGGDDISTMYLLASFKSWF